MGATDPHSIAQCGRRAAPRLRLRVPVHLITLNGQGRAIMENVSLTGARIASRFALRPGMSCLVQLPQLELFADVAWSSHGRCGLVFETPLSQQQLLAMRQLDIPIMTELEDREQWARNFVAGIAGSRV